MTHDTKFWLYMIFGYLLIMLAFAVDVALFGFIGGYLLFLSGVEATKDSYAID